jgi:hypothetical protein
MNETQARTLREAHDAYVKRLSRRTLPALHGDYRNELAANGRQLLMGGPVTRDELISALAELRYPAAKLNEASHVIGHQARGWSACNFCHDDDGTHSGSLCECDRWAETACTVCGRMAAYHFSTTYTHGGTARPTLTDHGRLGHAYQGRIRPLLHLSRADLATLANSGDEAALREWQLRDNGGQS